MAAAALAAAGARADTYLQELQASARQQRLAGERGWIKLVHYERGVLGGWQLYWIGYLQTGMFFSPTYSGSDRSNTNTVGGLPNRTCNGNLSSDQRSTASPGCACWPPSA